MADADRTCRRRGQDRSRTNAGNPPSIWMRNLGTLRPRSVSDGHRMKDWSRDGPVLADARIGRASGGARSAVDLRGFEVVRPCSRSPEDVPRRSSPFSENLSGVACIVGGGRPSTSSVDQLHKLGDRVDGRRRVAEVSCKRLGVLGNSRQLDVDGVDRLPCGDDLF